MTTHKIKIYDQLSDVDLVAPNLWEVDNCFDIQTFDWLCHVKETVGNEFFVSGIVKRLQLKSNMQDQLRLNQIGVDMSESLSSICGVPLRLMEAKYWIDMPGFGCSMHEDFKDLTVNYQVYVDTAIGQTLSETVLKARGAKFYHCDPPYEICFKPNHGYINLNTDLKPHDVAITADTRVSVIFQYSRV
jgi:hypothetical protein